MAKTPSKYGPLPIGKWVAVCDFGSTIVANGLLIALLPNGNAIILQRGNGLYLANIEEEMAEQPESNIPTEDKEWVLNCRKALKVN